MSAPATPSSTANASSDLRAIHLGPDDLVVASGILVSPAMRATDVTQSIVEAERRVRDALPFRTVIYLEPRLQPPSSQEK